MTIEMHPRGHARAAIRTGEQVMSAVVKKIARTRLRIALALLAVAGGLVTFAAVPASAGTVQGWARPGAGHTLAVRDGPGAGFDEVSTLSNNQEVTVYCYAVGSSVNGDVYWDATDNNTFVSDYWLYTGGNINMQGVEPCTQYFGTTPGIAVEPGGLPVYVNGPGSGSNGDSLYDSEYISTVSCWTTGPTVNGSDRWDEIFVPDLLTGDYLAYVSDYWLYTGGDVSLQVKHC